MSTWGVARCVLWGEEGMPMRDDSTADEGFDAFVRARWTATARLAYALTLDHQKAEDLAQEAFTKLWFRWQKVYEESPEGYLRRIVTTTFLSGRRRRPDRRAPHRQAAGDF